jgi:MFS family permease
VSQAAVSPGVQAHRRALAIGLVLAVTTFAFDSLSIAAAMPAIAADLGGVSLYGAAFSAFMIADVLSLAVAGPIADRRGPGPVLAIGLTLFTVGLVIGGVAPTMPIVVLGRFVQGLGAGTIGSTAYVVITRVWADHERARMFAVLSGAWIVPSLAAPAAAGIVADALSWRLVFLGLLPFPVIAAVLALGPLRELGPAAPELAGDGYVRSRIAVGSRLAFGLLLVVLGLERDVPVVAVALVAVGAVIAFPAFRSLMPAGTLRAASGLPAVVISRLMISWAFFGTDAFIPLLVTEVHGETTRVAGLALTAAGLAWSTAAWGQSHLMKTRSETFLVVGGTLLIAAGIGAVALALSSDAPLWFVFVGWALGGAGMGFAANTTSVGAMARAEKGKEGATTSAYQLADFLGVALATGLGGAIVAAGERNGWDASATLGFVFALTAAPIVPCLLASRRIGHPALVASAPLPSP